MFNDALNQAKITDAQWPFTWVQTPEYTQKSDRATVTGKIVLNDPQAATTKLPHLNVGLTHPDFNGSGGGFAERSGNGTLVTWEHDANYYQFWTVGSEDGTFTIPNVRPGTYTLHAFADGVLGEYTNYNITVDGGQSSELGQSGMEARPLRPASLGNWIPRPHRRQILQGRRLELLALGLVCALPAPVPERHHLHHWQERLSQRLVLRAGPARGHHSVDKSRREGPRQPAFWLGQGAGIGRLGAPLAMAARPPGPSNSTWTRPSAGKAFLRVALAGSDGTAGLANPGAHRRSRRGGQRQSARHDPSIATNALRYNTDKGVWREYVQTFDAALLKAGENEIQLTVPAGELTSGVVYDYLRLELAGN